MFLSILSSELIRLLGFEFASQVLEFVTTICKSVCVCVCVCVCACVHVRVRVPVRVSVCVWGIGVYANVQYKLISPGRRSVPMTGHEVVAAPER